MKRRRWLYVSLLAGFAGLVLYGLYRREPRYQGKTFSEWMEQDALYEVVQIYDVFNGFNYTKELQARHERKEKEFHNLVMHFGTRGIPIYLEMLKASDSKLRLKLIELAQKQKYVKISFVPAETKQKVALRALGELHGDAASATPKLIKMYVQARTVETRKLMLHALAYIGPGAQEATPVLLGATTDTNAEIRVTALDTLWSTHPDPHLALVPLLRSLQDSDSMASFRAACAIEGLKGNKNESVQELEELLRALDRKWVLGLLLQTVHDKKPMVVGTSAWALAAFGEEAKPAVPVLVEVVEGKWRGGTGKMAGSVGAPVPTRKMVAEALQKIDPETAATLLPKYPELAK